MLARGGFAGSVGSVGWVWDCSVGGRVVCWERVERARVRFLLDLLLA